MTSSTLFIRGGRLASVCSVVRSGRVAGIHTGPKGSTFVYQSSLPRLRVPSLESTLEKYQRTAGVLLTDDEVLQTKKLAEEFLSGRGKELNAELVARDVSNSETSFITPFWDDMYYTLRAPLPINVNPFLQFRKHEKAEHNEPVRRAASLVSASLAMHDALRDESLDPDVIHLRKTTQQPWFKMLVRLAPSSMAYYLAAAFKGFPLDMSQYARLFASTRIPKRDRDIMKITPNGGSNHIIVMSQDHFYKVPVRVNGQALPIGAIERTLSAIVKDSQEAGRGPAVGLLTSQNRDVWADVRQHMEKDATNAATLEDIDSALFVVCLDKEAPESNSEIAHTLLHGDGALNRWFDQSFSLIVCANGVSGVNFEHAWGDGVSILRYANEVLEDASKTPDWWKSGDNDTVAFERLPWSLDSTVDKAIEEAGQAIQGTIGALNFQVATYTDVGKDTLKALKMSPDAVAQLAFQVAYYRQYGKFVSTYESGSTAGFKFGRTETIRPLTPEAADFVTSFVANRGGEDATKKDLVAKLRASGDRHRKVSTEATTGKGFDRHMFALFCIAKQLGGDIPEIFADKAWGLVNHNTLSTSTLTSPFIVDGGFGPVTADGYGIGYAVHRDNIHVVVSSYKPADEASQFVSGIGQALTEMQALLQGQ